MSPSYSDSKKSKEIIVSHLLAEGISETEKAYESIAEARKALNVYLEYYNCERRHQSLDRRTPYDVYWSSLTEQRAAA